MKTDNMEPDSLPRETLVELAKMFFRNSRIVDGLWFQKVEDEFGLDAAVKLDQQVWEIHAQGEAKRIKDTLDLKEEGPEAVLKALKYTLSMDTPEIEESGPDRIVIRINNCPVHEARARKGRPQFPCKEQGLTIYPAVAKEIDPRVKVRCLMCPPDPHPEDVWCRWEFTI